MGCTTVAPSLVSSKAAQDRAYRYIYCSIQTEASKAILLGTQERHRQLMSRLSPRSVFAKRLRKARLALGISQRELGRRIGLSEDVVSSRVTRYERGSSEPDFEIADRLAKELGVPLAYLLADSDTLAEVILAVASMPPAEQRKLANELKEKGKR